MPGTVQPGLKNITEDVSTSYTCGETRLLFHVKRRELLILGRQIKHLRPLIVKFL